MKTDWRVVLFRPFEKIAGGKALLWGVLGLIVSTILSLWSDLHYHKLLHYGGAPNNLIWVYAVERLVVWLIPAILFLFGGLILSKSKVRLLDVVGTTAFAQLPLLGVTISNFLTPKELLTLDPSSITIDEYNTLLTFSAVLASLLMVLFVTWMMIWMFNALKVSCNLKSTTLVLWYIFAVLGGDILCRIIISGVTT